MASYHNEQGQIVDFYVAFNSSQRKGVATHSPESCLPSSGWIFQKSSIQQIDMGNGVKIHVSRVMATNKGSQFMVYYWFPQRGRILTSLYQVKLYNFWDALTKKRTDGALVRIISEVYPNETIDMTNDRMISFIRAVKPLIDEYVPN
jgi:EpsI family protein